MVTKSKSIFLSKVTHNAREHKQKMTSFAYLRLPRGVAMFKEEAGARMRFDIMPYVVKGEHHPDRDDEFEVAIPGSQWYKRPFRTHRNVGVDNATVVCPTSVGKKCPICDYRARLLKEGVNWQDESVKALRPSERALYVVIPIGHAKYEEVPHIWDISQYLFQEKLDAELEENEEAGRFPDLEDGLTLKVRFSEEVFQKSKYADTSRIDFETRDRPYKPSIMEKIPCLDEVLDVNEYSTLERMFMEAGEAPTVRPKKDEEDETPRRRRREESDEAPTARPRKDEEEDETPRRRRREESDEESDGAKPEPKEEKEEPRALRTRTREPEDEEPPAKAPKEEKTVAKRAAKDSMTCPYGHTFGKDADEYPECGKCELWDDCMRERERLERAG